MFHPVTTKTAGCGVCMFYTLFLRLISVSSVCEPIAFLSSNMLVSLGLEVVRAWSPPVGLRGVGKNIHRDTEIV